MIIKATVTHSEYTKRQIVELFPIVFNHFRCIIWTAKDDPKSNGVRYKKLKEQKRKFGGVHDNRTYIIREIYIKIYSSVISLFGTMDIRDIREPIFTVYETPIKLDKTRNRETDPAGTRR